MAARTAAVADRTAAFSARTTTVAARTDAIAARTAPVPARTAAIAASTAAVAIRKDSKTKKRNKRLCSWTKRKIFYFKTRNISVTKSERSNTWRYVQFRAMALNQPCHRVRGKTAFL